MGFVRDTAYFQHSEPEDNPEFTRDDHRLTTVHWSWKFVSDVFFRRLKELRLQEGKVEEV